MEDQANKRREVEMTLKLLEKDARAKQATVGALRKQLEDIKGFSDDIASKLKVYSQRVLCNLIFTGLLLHVS